MNTAMYKADIYWLEEDNCYISEVLGLNGCISRGKTLQELIINTELNIRECIEASSNVNPFEIPAAPFS